MERKRKAAADKAKATTQTPRKKYKKARAIYDKAVRTYRKSARRNTKLYNKYVSTYYAFHNAKKQHDAATQEEKTNCAAEETGWNDDWDSWWAQTDASSTAKYGGTTGPDSDACKRSKAKVSRATHAELLANRTHNRAKRVYFSSSRNAKRKMRAAKRTYQRKRRAYVRHLHSRDGRFKIRRRR